MNIEIDLGTIADVLHASSNIPEFNRVTTRERVEHKLAGVSHLILIAKSEAKIVGFKVGYELNKETFYSWLGGVVPAYRGQGIASLLLKRQEDWATLSGYQRIEVKSMNRYPSMLKLLISHGYSIIGVEDSELEMRSLKQESKILFAKELAPQAREGQRGQGAD
ncbi:MAG: GNAT family N-acetyltransferase [Idiomarina sp.]|nr:GNAT family N-acetyltransferase [Idiomarina sp.]